MRINIFLGFIKSNQQQKYRLHENKKQKRQIQYIKIKMIHHEYIDHSISKSKYIETNFD
jgi:hypothetical protein